MWGAGTSADCLRPPTVLHRGGNAEPAAVGGEQPQTEKFGRLLKSRHGIVCGRSQ